MNLAQFHQLVEQTWDEIEEKIDDEGLSVDTEIQGAVCTLTFDDDSQIIINKQSWIHTAGCICHTVYSFFSKSCLNNKLSISISLISFIFLTKKPIPFLVTI